MISCVNPFVLSLQCFSFKSCDMGLAQLCHHGVIVVTSPWHSCANAVLQLCQLGDRIPVIVFNVCIKFLCGGNSAVSEDIQYMLLFGRRE